MSISDLKIINTDKMKKDYLLPVRIVWHSEGMDNTDILLTNTEEQPRMGQGVVARASTQEGKKAAVLLDFGSEISGGARIVTRMGTDKQGALVRLRFGESVQEAMTPLGEKNGVNHHSIRDMVVPLPLLSCTEWSQTGFRFLYLEIETPDVYIEFGAIHGIFTYRDIPYYGTFECNDVRVNKIYQTSAYTVHLNMQNMLWDGVKRDRLVWMNEASGAGIYALLALTLDGGAYLCKAVGDTETSDLCRIKRKLLDDNRNAHHNMKQVIAMMNLAGHISDKEAATLLTKDGGKGMSTFQSYYILKAASQTAGITSALDMMREYYGAMLDVGATTFWEDFDLDWMREGATIEEVLPEGAYDIHGDNGRFCYTGFRHSLCHGWSAGPTAFLAEEVLGIKILSPGCKKVSICPQLGDLEWVKGTYPTPYGNIYVEASRCGEQTETKICVPEGVEIQ